MLMPVSGLRHRCRTAGVMVVILSGAHLVGGVIGGCASGGAESPLGRAVEPADFIGPGRTTANHAGDAAPAAPTSADAGASAGDGELPEALPEGLQLPPDEGPPSAEGGGPAEAAPPGGSPPRAEDEAAAPSGRQRQDRRPAARTPPPANAVDARRPSWIVDGLVGQINGRPIFADEFLAPIGDRLGQLVHEYDRLEARRGIIQIVSDRFDDWVDSELIIAEAESLLSPEEKEGLFAWIKNLQESEIVKRGGTRTSAQASVSEQYGDVTLEEILTMTKNRALAGDLLRKRVAPRALVTWRDVERGFDRLVEEAPKGPTLILGRIQFRTASQGAEIEEVTRLFADGRTFEEVAEKLELPDGGVWALGKLELGPEGIEGTPLREEYKAQLRQLQPGQVSPAFEVGSSTIWIAILAREDPPTLSIYDRDLQLEIRGQLEAERETIERERYIASLRRQWVAEGIEDMRARLIEIALRRYWE